LAIPLTEDFSSSQTRCAIEGNGSTTLTSETETSRGVYRLMSMTGANLQEALYCWKTSSEDLYGALPIYFERIYPQNRVLQSPRVIYLEDEDCEASSKES